MSEWDTPETRAQVRESIKRQIAETQVEIEEKAKEEARKKIESGFAGELGESILSPVHGDDWQATNFNTEIVDVKLPEGVVVLPFLGFPVEEVTELDWHRREKEQQAIYKDLMDEVAAQEINDEIRQRAIWEERRQLPIRQAEEYLASCSDEKDAESCAFWKARREKLFEEHMERAKILAEADAAYICKRSLPQDPDLLNFVEIPPGYVVDKIEVEFGGIKPRDAWVSEMGRAFKSINAALEEEAEDWNNMALGLMKIKDHAETVKNYREENKHLIITNRVLTILLIFSTAFGITAALAWLRCQ